MSPRIRRRPAISGEAGRGRYVRFVLARRNRASGVADGIFGVAWRLAESSRTARADHTHLSELLDWVSDHLPDPTRVNRSRSKGARRRNSRGISWLKDDATVYLAKFRQLSAILEKYGHRVEMIWEDRVGYIVYEDEFQVVAEPFADTGTEGD